MGFIDMRREVGISDAGLTRILKSLRKARATSKENGGRYELTPARRRSCPQAQRASFTLVLISSWKGDVISSWKDDDDRAVGDSADRIDTTQSHIWCARECAHDISGHSLCGDVILGL